MVKKSSFFSTREVRPAGWLKKQLELQAKGLCGNLDLIWPDIRDSKWIGGNREGWERVPFWLDGFLPMAYLLEDADLIARAQRYVENIIENQQEDGWICPNGETPREKYDTWAILLIGKVLKVYYDCTGDHRIPNVLYRTMKNYYDLLSSGTIQLFGWAKARWYEVFPILTWLQKDNPDATWISSLAKILREQGLDYTTVTDRWLEVRNERSFETHIVNLMMMFKFEAVSCDLLGEKYLDKVEMLHKVLARYHRTPVGLFNGDENLAGISPIQGTELCAVVEQMYSYELLYAYTGDKKWAERLEVVAFNALPATISEDMWSHQYDQQSNQISAYPLSGNPIFTSNSRDANRFGLEPNFGCCTANFGQGWPKLILSTFLRSKNGIDVALPVPAKLSTTWKSTPIRITVESDYPFKNRVQCHVWAEKDTNMVLTIRIPSFAENLIVNGKQTDIKQNVIIRGFKAGETKIEISFTTEPKLLKSPCKMQYAKCGSLVFSLPIEAEWVKKEYELNGVERKYPYCDYDVFGRSDWNYGYTTSKLTKNEYELDKDVPFSTLHPSVTLTTDMSHIDWGTEPRYPNLCARLPKHKKPLDESHLKTLIPYGCAKLRMTEMPLINEKKEK